MVDVTGAVQVHEGIEEKATATVQGRGKNSLRSAVRLGILVKARQLNHKIEMADLAQSIPANELLHRLPRTDVRVHVAQHTIYVRIVLEQMLVQFCQFRGAVTDTCPGMILSR